MAAASAKFDLAATSKQYRANVMTAGMAAIKSGKGTDGVVQAAAQATLQAGISTAAGIGGAAVCGAVAGPVGALCGPVVAAIAGKLTELISGLFSSGPNPIQLKADECKRTLTALEEQYITVMENLIALHYQLWPTEFLNDATFQPFTMTALYKVEPMGRREQQVSIKLWNKLAQMMVDASVEAAAWLGLARVKSLAFPVVEQWAGKTFAEPVYVNPIASLQAAAVSYGMLSTLPAVCFLYAQQASIHLRQGSAIWFDIGTGVKRAAVIGAQEGVTQKNPACKAGLLRVRYGSGAGAIRCINPDWAFQEDPVPRIQKMVDYLNGSAQLLKPALDRVLVELYAQKSDEDIQAASLQLMDLQEAKNVVAAWQRVLAARESELRDLDRKYDDAKSGLADAKLAAHDMNRKDMDKAIATAQRNTKWAWAAAAVVVGGAVLYARRAR